VPLSSFLGGASCAIEAFLGLKEPFSPRSLSQRGKGGVDKREHYDTLLDDSHNARTVGIEPPPLNPSLPVTEGRH
jgi:hypothetical protein